MTKKLQICNVVSEGDTALHTEADLGVLIPHRTPDSASSEVSVSPLMSIRGHTTHALRLQGHGEEDLLPVLRHRGIDAALLGLFEGELSKERLKRLVKQTVDAEELPPTPMPPTLSLADRLTKLDFCRGKSKSDNRL